MSEFKPWSAQVNDIVGGWIVTNYPHSLSQHDNRLHSQNGYVIAECTTERDARLIALRLNVMEYVPEALMPVSEGGM